MPCREQTACAILVFDHFCFLCRITPGRIDMAGHLEVLDVKVVTQAKTDSLLFLLIRILPQERMRGKRLDGIDFWRICVRNARRQHMANTCETPDFWDPDTVEFCIGGQAVAMIVSHIAIRALPRIEAHVSFSFVQGIVRITPRRTRPISRERRPRRDVDDIEKSSRIVDGISSRIPYIMRRCIFILQFVPITPHVVIESIRKAVVELFEERLERSILCGNFAFIQFEAEKIPAHSELDIGQVAFKHSGRQVVAL